MKKQIFYSNSYYKPNSFVAGLGMKGAWISYRCTKVGSNAYHTCCKFVESADLSQEHQRLLSKGFILNEVYIPKRIKENPAITHNQIAEEWELLFA
jgi:hypothetical protein